MCVCVCACVRPCARVWLHVGVCVYVCEREKEKGSQRLLELYYTRIELKARMPVGQTVLTERERCNTILLLHPPPHPLTPTPSVLFFDDLPSNRITPRTTAGDFAFYSVKV